ncbi:MAG: 6-phosphogluconolactonase, partial [Candidatus Hydrogenedentales bacterium]
MTVHISESPAVEAAAAFAALCASSEGPLFVAASGGSTPRDLFRLWASEYRERIPWERITLFQVDERCVPPDDAQSNWKMLNEELLAKVPGVKACR